MVEGIDVYKEMFDNIKYLDTFLKLYPPHRDYIKQPHKYQVSARHHYARALDCVELLDKELLVLKSDCKNLADYLKAEHLNNILNLELDLEWEYLNINQRFVKVFDSFSILTEDVEYLKKADERMLHSHAKIYNKRKKV